MTHRRFRPSRDGNSALLLLILMLGFMMSLSTSYVQMVQTETRGAAIVDNVGRARDAALSGIYFVQGKLQATTSTFLPQERIRLYFRYSDVGADRNADGFFKATYPFVATSQWFYLSVPSVTLENEAASSSIFRVVSYPDTTASDTYNYYVKSQGAFRDLGDGLSTPAATWTAQIWAHLFINPGTNIVLIRAWRTMELEDATSVSGNFYKRHQIR